MNNLTGKYIRALSWKQPFATLMFHGKIETRIWPTNYRGLVLICTSKKLYTGPQIEAIAGLVQCQRIFEHIGETNMFPGHAIGIGRLVDCRKMQPKDEDKCFVQYFNDLYCHVYEEVQEIQPIEWKGSQGWRTVDPDFIKKIKFK